MKTKIENYSPLYFLASLWAGWLSVTFFMYLMFMTKHPDTPIPTFNSLLLQFNTTNTHILLKWTIIIWVIWILFFAYKHIRLLILNLVEYNKFRKTKEYSSIKKSNKEVQLMALPLTLAMSVNVLFIIWAVFVPNLWNYVEFLFPFALIAFWSIGILALKIFSEYMTRLLTSSSFDFTENNNLSQMLSVFAFAMVWVWFAASAAMSHNTISAIIWMIGSIFFITLALFFWAIKFFIWFKSILRNWLSKEASPTIWIIIPLLTLVWISFVRQSHWLEHNLAIEISTWIYFVLTTIFLSLQLIFWYIGYKIMKSNKYFDTFLNGNKKSPWSYALICPWVALVVFWFFFIHLWLVKTWIITKFSIPYFIILSPLIYLQFITIRTLLKLNKKML